MGVVRWAFQDSKSGKLFSLLSHECKLKSTVNYWHEEFNKYEVFNQQLLTNIYHVIFQKILGTYQMKALLKQKCNGK